MLKKLVPALAAASLLATTQVPSAMAFDIGGSNGWKFSTDGFLNVFGTYESVQARPAGVIGGELGSGGNVTTPTAAGERDQQFRVRTGLLPVGIGFNIKSPVVDGVQYGIRLGIYPQIQNNGGSHTDISPNIDFREINATADGSFGQVLAGRALNLYQGKNILTDMTLFGAGVVGPVNSGPTMGHIGYGYLYPNFGAQIRYTTPDMAGVKWAVSVNDTSDIGAATVRNIPRFESELSWATTYTGGKAQAWLSGLWERNSFATTQPIRPGQHVDTVGGAGGLEGSINGLDLLVSCYGGQALGMLGMNGADALSADGQVRPNWGFLTQATYQLTKTWKLGLNYGQSRAEKAGNDTDANIMKQQAAVAAITYNVNSFVQLMAEYTWAQDRWFNGEHQNGNMGAIGTFIYW
ncbi:hypothetical protein [Geomonas sp.]|uniref:hypothetical protein n=1 Tax=Geomonas sp. TaxID=2651584 RepID=UPI002B482191|nr:hypothetical protein [Geomonas sp.]HJV36466.1 hypothetical protein [Geomonas sp.]